MTTDFSQKYSSSQRQAIVRLGVVEGLRAGEAVARAREGVLGLEPFEMNVQTARIYIARARRQHKEHGFSQLLKDDPEGAVHHLAVRIVALAEDALEAIEKGERVFKPDEILTIVKIVVTASDLAKRNKPRKGNLGMLSVA